MKKAVVLISGGLDSTTCLAYAISKGYECYTLSFDYGQRHRAELLTAETISRRFKAKQHKLIKLTLGLQHSALTDENIPIPDYLENDTSIPVTYVPARNTIFLSVALGWAEILKAQTIFIGVSSVDYSNYPDCRPEYIQAYQAMANLATQGSIEGEVIAIETPLIMLSKAETIQLGLSLKVDYSQTITCYRATSNGLACGHCHSCGLRKKGFHEAGVKDPTRYVS